MAHWLDDMFDRQINRRHLSRRIFSTDRESQYDPAKQVDPKFKSIIERVMTDITHRDYASVAIERLMLGSLIFHTGSIAEKAAVRHRKLIRKYLLDDDDWSQKKAVLNWFENIMNHMFVHLTAKTIQELWFACEEMKQPFGLTFLYSVLYIPHCIITIRLMRLNVEKWLKVPALLVCCQMLPPWQMSLRMLAG